MVRAKYLMRKMSSVLETANGRDIIYKFMSSGFPGLPVVNEKREIVGIVTDFDLIRAIQTGKEPDAVTACEIMSKKVITAGLDTPQAELIKIMIENNLNIVPIVKDNKLWGIVSRLDIMDAYIDPGLYKWIEREREEDTPAYPDTSGFI